MKENRCEDCQCIFPIFPTNKQFVIFQMLLSIGINSAGNGLESEAIGKTIKNFSNLFK
jgi:hypothetical protein